MDLAANLTGEYATEVYKADSIPLLGTAIGAANIQATVTKYNQIVQDAWDGTVNADAAENGGFGKANSVLTNKIISTSGGSYYAIKIYPQTMGSFGGVLTDGNCRVLNKDEEVVPNLYAVGECANRDLYSMNPTYGATTAAGSSLAHYGTMGWVAGIHAAENLDL